MNENINLIEILKDAPKGTKLYSPICGECKYVGFGGCKTIVVQSSKENIIYFTKEGKYYAFEESAECLLFPSKDNRDWSTFKAPWKHKHFEPYQKVLVASGSSEIWEPDIYGYYDDKRKRHRCFNHYAYDNDIIPYEENEDKLGKPIKL